VVFALNTIEKAALSTKDKEPPSLLKEISADSKYRVALFDVDGVILTPEKFFFEVHAEANNISPDNFHVFFNSSGFGDALKGKADLKELIVQHPQLWGDQRSPDEILQDWLVVEGAVDYELVENIKAIKQSGVKVCLATNQFSQKKEYIVNQLVPGIFDYVFSSSDLGHIKPDPRFFSGILEQLKSQPEFADLVPAEIVFFDDKTVYVDSAKSLGLDGVVYEHPRQVNEISLGLFAAEPV
jgi:putative hydrolase of the HAD superfamily